MAFIFPDESVGNRLGQGLSQGLQALAQMKLQQYQQKQQEPGLQQMFPEMKPEGIQALSRLSPEYAKYAIPQMLKNAQLQKSLQYIDQTSGGNQGDQTGGLGILNGSSGVRPSLATKAIPASTNLTTAPTSGNVPIKTKPSIQPSNLPELNRPISTNAAKIAVAMGSPVDKAIRIQQEDRKIAAKDRQFAIKTQLAETKKGRETVSEAARYAPEDLRNLNIQKNLVASGQLIGQLGLDASQIEAFKNGESQVFTKLSVPYFRQLKPKFGAKPTQWDAQQLQKSFPNLYQTDEGKLVIIEMMMDDAKMARKTMRMQEQIINENGGIPPLNLAEMLDQRMESYRAKRFAKLKNDISNVMVATAGPGMSAEAAFKEAQRIGMEPVVQNENGVQFRTDGKKWIMEWS
jgi:hypothetical protein